MKEQKTAALAIVSCVSTKTKLWKLLLRQAILYARFDRLMDRQIFPPLATETGLVF